MIGLQLPIPSTFLNRRCHIPRRRSGPCALTKQGQRFLTSVATNPSASHHALRKFIGSSSKHVVLDTLSHLLSPNSTHSHLSSIALPLYLMIKECSWFNWNAKIEAEAIALMFKLERLDLAETLQSEAVNELGFQNARSLCDFYCHLVYSCAKFSLKEKVFDCCDHLKQLIHSSGSSVYIKQRATDSMVGALCEIGFPREAEALLEEMRGSVKLKPSAFAFRSLIYAYGQLGILEDMNRTLAQLENEGFVIDTVSSNMVLSSLGAHQDLVGMSSWLQKVKTSGVSVSIRTFNSVLNTCPMITSMLLDLKSIPLTNEELMSSLSQDEANLMQELIVLPILDQVVVCDTLDELKLDLHGSHLSSAYVIFLLWIKELRSRFLFGNHTVPREIAVVCGSGKHSSIRGQSPVKGLIKEMIFRMRCPLKMERGDGGCFVAKGHVFSNWLQI